MGEARGRASFIVIVGLESPPCLIGMDIMRPLRVHIDVTNGTATPAQPDPQTVHLNAAQSQPQQTSEPTPLIAGPPPAPKPLEDTPSPGASLLPGGTAEPSSPQSQRQKIPLSGAGSSGLPPPAKLHQVPLCRLPHRALPTLTLLVMLGCFRPPTSPPSQLASSAAITLGLLRTSFFARVTLSRLL